VPSDDGASGGADIPHVLVGGNAVSSIRMEQEEESAVDTNTAAEEVEVVGVGAVQDAHGLDGAQMLTPEPEPLTAAAGEPGQLEAFDAQVR
jgi:hypothetical protein